MTTTVTVRSRTTTLQSPVGTPRLPVPHQGLVLLGPPGAGKGTQAELLALRFGLEHVATGALLRAHVAAGTPQGLAAQQAMDTGELVGDDLVTEMVLDRLTDGPTRRRDHGAVGTESSGGEHPHGRRRGVRVDGDAAASTVGYVLDGYPRTLTQARSLDRWLAGLGAAVPLAVSLEVSEDEILARLARRAHELGRRDDDAATVRHRLQVFAARTRPLTDHYAATGRLVTVPAVGSTHEVTTRILRALGAPTP